MYDLFHVLNCGTQADGWGGLLDFLSSLPTLLSGRRSLLGLGGYWEAPTLLLAALCTPAHILFCLPHCRVLWTRSPYNASLDRKGLHQRGGQDVPGPCRPHP